MSFCPACGSENTSDQKFCNNCGTPLSGSTGPGPAPLQPSGQIPAATAATTPPQSRNIKMIIGIVVAIAVIGAIVFIGLPMMKNSQNSSGFEPAKSTTASTVLPTQVPTPVETTVIYTQVTTEPIPTTAPQTTQSAMKTYTSPRFGFSIDYPEGWEVDEKNLLETPSLTRYNVIEFHSPSINRCDTDKTSCAMVRSTVMVEVETSPGTKELADYYVPQVAKITSQGGVEITKKDSGYKLSGVKAYRLDYSSRIDNNDINVLSAYTLISNNAYIITYRAYAPTRLEENQFELYYNTVMEMYKSFTAQGAVKVLQ